jgi:betaine-homocysteine S-methyltransferase
MKRTLTERLGAGEIVICGEGYVFELERRGYVKAGAFVPEVVLDFPEAVKELHREYLRAGSDVVLALTYYAHRGKLRAVQREADIETLNRLAIRLAREIAGDGDALVAGNLCNSWEYDPADPGTTGKKVREMYREQIEWAADEGVDLILAETLNYLGEAEIALELIRDAGLPAVINFIPLHETTGEGVPLAEACRRLSDRGAEVVGLNCGRGPQTILPLLAKVIANAEGPVGALPVAYRTDAAHPNFLGLRHAGCRHGFPVELEPFLLTRYEMADFALQAREMGARYIGVCCGGAPHHVRAMAEALGRTTPASRFSPDLSQHAVFGTDAYVKEHEQWRFKEDIERVKGGAG